MKSNPGVEIESITGGSLAEGAGLLPGDKIIKVNGHKIKDAIDLMFYSNGPELHFTVGRKGARLAMTACMDGNETVGARNRVEIFSYQILQEQLHFLFCFAAPERIEEDTLSQG